MSAFQPKYVALDTSTYINLLRRQTDVEVKDTLDALKLWDLSLLLFCSLT